MERIFIILGITLQALLLANFAVRTLRPALERDSRWGTAIYYLLAAPPLLVGLIFLLGGQPATLVAGPLLFGVWAVLGYWVDVLRRVDWRARPGSRLFLAYVALYTLGQFGFLLPMLKLHRGYGLLYAVLYVVQTALNAASHGRR